MNLNLFLVTTIRINIDVDDRIQIGDKTDDKIDDGFSSLI